MVDTQQVSQIAQQISSSVTQSALYAAHVNAVVNSIQDSFGFGVFLICTFLAIRWLNKISKRYKQGCKERGSYDHFDAAADTGFINIALGLIGSIGFLVGLLQGIGGFTSIFMDFYGLSHPDAYLAYQLMNKVTN